MPDASGNRGPFTRLPLRLRVAAGLAFLWLAAWSSLYGKLNAFEPFDAPRFTSKAILSGSLHMRSALAHVGHDEQVYNGAVYTNWGFGVPLMQAPFHALAAWVNAGSWFFTGFFPDRAIFFFYMAALAPLLWSAIDRLLRSPPGSPAWAPSTGVRLAVSWAGTWLTLVLTLYPFPATRFVVYEETLGYLAICQLVALSAYVRSQPDRPDRAAFAGGIGTASGATGCSGVPAVSAWRADAWVALTAAAAGMGLLVRPTGLIHLGVWGAVFALGELRRTSLGERARRTMVFALVAVPFLSFWMWSNRVRTGTPFGFGLNNSNPAWSFGTPAQRFGSVCIDSPLHAAQAFGRLLQAFFLYVTPHAPAGSWLNRCHVGFEERDGTGEPFFGPVVLVLLLWILVDHLRRRETRLALYMPFAAMGVLLASYTYAGAEFVWRYSGDFWPLIVLACVMALQVRGPSRAGPVTPRLAKFLFWAGAVFFFRSLVPFQWSTRAEVLDWPHVASMAADFEEARRGRDAPHPSRKTVRGPFSPLYHDRLGWNADGTVDTFTNVYLGVPRRADGAGGHRIHFSTDGIQVPGLRVYCNRRLYQAEREGDGYGVEVAVVDADLVSPIVMVTIEWVHALDPIPGVKLLAIELS